MEILRGFSDIDLDVTGSAVSIGNFDGVHLGHQAVIGSAVAAANAADLASVACTFDPHTRVFLRPDAPPRLLETLDQRLAAVAELGVDIAVVIPFDADVAGRPRERFVADFLVGGLKTRSLHVSSAFTFGAGGKGDVDYLAGLPSSSGFDLQVVPSVIAGGEPVSSTRVRDSLEEGRVEAAAAILGRPFALIGEVVHGEGRGESLDARTANLAFENSFVPARGVYVTEARVRGQAHPAITNVGVRPTFGAGGDLTVETHLLGGPADLYGAGMEVAFLKRLRGEMTFDSPSTLAAQIAHDIEQAHAFFSALPPDVRYTREVS